LLQDLIGIASVVYFGFVLSILVLARLLWGWSSRFSGADVAL